METEKFMVIMKERFEHCVAIMAPKDKEYTRNGDKLHNFKVAARIKNETPEEALWGMGVKHLVSIIDMIDDVSINKLPSREMIAEKFGDMHNYLFLLEALIIERIENEERAR